MAGLLTALSVSAQSLDAQSQGVQLSGKNISNADNSSYARETLVLSEGAMAQTSVGPQAEGTVATGIQGVRDPFLDADVTSEIAQTGALQSLDTNLQVAQANLGESINTSNDSSSVSDSTQSTTGVSSAITNFFSDVQGWSADPTDAGTQQTLLEQAGTMATTINNVYGSLQTVQSNIDTQAASDTQSASSLLSDVAALNTQITGIDASGSNTAPDLVDQRQADLEKLAGYMDFTATEESTGETTITANGASGPVTLVSGGTVQGSLNYSSSSSQVTWDAVGASGGSGTQLELQGGSLAGEINAKTGAIATLMQNVQLTAQQLATSVNAAYNPTGSSTGNFFAAAPTSGIIQVDPNLTQSTLTASATGNAGANDIALAVAAVGTQSFSTSGTSPALINGTISGFYSSSVDGFATSVSNADSQLSEQQTVQNLVESQRDSVSGVNADDEETNLMQYQKAYEAVAKVISAIDTLLGEVITMGGGAT
jgi:flagellar hook-associated protein 1 FlgK